LSKTELRPDAGRSDTPPFDADDLLAWSTGAAVGTVIGSAYGVLTDAPALVPIAWGLSGLVAGAAVRHWTKHRRPRQKS
jgi:hypothetical protein